MMNDQRDTLLWRIISRQSQPAAYLFGTMHSGGEVAVSKVSQVFPFICQSANYFGESDIDRLMVQPLPVTLSDWSGLKYLISKGAYLKARWQLKRRFDLDLDQIQQLPPMFLTTLISEKILSTASLQALDIQMWNLAKHMGLTVRGLESVEEQALIYSRIPLKFQIRQLKKLVLNLSAAAKGLAKLEKAYQSGNLRLLYRMTHKQLSKTKRLILYDRNQMMADRIQAYIASNVDPCFFAVGAAHIPGSQGLIKILKTKGMILEAVPTK